MWRPDKQCRLRLRRWPCGIVARIWESRRGTLGLWDRLIGEVSTCRLSHLSRARQNAHFNAAITRRVRSRCGMLGLWDRLIGELSDAATKHWFAAIFTTCS